MQKQSTGDTSVAYDDRSSGTARVRVEVETDLPQLVACGTEAHHGPSSYAQAPNTRHYKEQRR